MQLTYFRDRGGNFGDDLNEWLWERAAPGFCDEDPNVVLLGIGTLLGDWFLRKLPGRHKVCIGSGAGKGNPPTVGPDWSIFGVRGPLTAAYLGLEHSKIAADPAVLIHDWTDLYEARTHGGTGFMPHVWSARVWNWKPVCEALGLIYIDPEADSLETIRKIGSLEKLVTEAMHGAIVADAVRVPWIATRISNRFDAGKWCDWGASVGVDVKFHHLPELQRGAPGLLGSIKGDLKRLAMTVGAPIKNSHFTTPSRVERAMSKSLLNRLAKQADVQLSSNKALRLAVRRVKDAIHAAQESKVSAHF